MYTAAFRNQAMHGGESGLLGKAGTIVVAATAAVMAFTVPESNVVGTYALHAGTDYVLARTSISGGTQDRSCAQHDKLVASTGGPSNPAAPTLMTATRPATALRSGSAKLGNTH